MTAPYFPPFALLGGRTLSCPTPTAGLGSPIPGLTICMQMCGPGFAGLPFELTIRNATSAIFIKFIPQSYDSVANTGVALAEADVFGIIVPIPPSVVWRGTVPMYAQTSGGVGYSGPFFNFMMSLNFNTGIWQAYCNDTALPVISPGASGGTINNTDFNVSIDFLGADGFANVWLQPAAYDLSVTANRRQWINADLSSVQLPSNGAVTISGVGSVSPAVFLAATTLSADAIVNNSGSAAAWGVITPATPSLVLDTACLVTVPLPPPSANATLADLFFSEVPGFVDFTVESNRRRFITATGGARSLGTDGSAPYGTTPVVFLTRTGAPLTFANNNGRGGTFPVFGTALTAGATNPPGSAVSTLTFTPATGGQGVLGDYRNGNLYAFNPATLTDNGTARKWIRRWRALPQETMAAVKFSSLTIDMQTGIGISDGARPQLVLRWSDDGGFTWSDDRILAVGIKGDTTATIKFNRLGMTRRFAGSDRLFELSSTDPFVVSIMDAEVDVG